MVNLEDIKCAAKRIANYVHRTPILHSDSISKWREQIYTLNVKICRKPVLLKRGGRLTGFSC